MTKTQNLIWSWAILTGLIWHPTWALSTPKSAHASSPGMQNGTPTYPKRIISLAPSTTEILFALGLGDRVVGVTRYCDYPPHATQIDSVGGFFDPNFEKIATLRPDVTILLTSHGDVRNQLEKMGIQTLVTPHESLADIHKAIELIGDTCGAPNEAADLLAALIRRKQAVVDAVFAKTRPRVLICVNRDRATGDLSRMFAAGRGSLYDEIITLAGGTNACAEASLDFPQLSAEGVLHLNPDVIIDLLDQPDPSARAVEKAAQHWARLHTVTAVQKGRVHVVTGFHALRPSPRYVIFLEELAHILHPDGFARGGSDD